MKEGKCITCRYLLIYEADFGGKEKETRSVCRRYPPKEGDYFPRILDPDYIWCGEHRRVK